MVNKDHWLFTDADLLVHSWQVMKQSRKFINVADVVKCNSTLG